MRFIFYTLVLLFTNGSRAQGVDSLQNQFIIDFLSTQDNKLWITGNPEKPIYIDTIFFAKCFEFFKDSSLIDVNAKWGDYKSQILYNNEVKWRNLGLDLIYPVEYTKSEAESYQSYHENASLPIALGPNQHILFKKWTTSEVFERKINATLWTKEDTTWKSFEFVNYMTAPIINCVDCRTINCFVDRFNEPCLSANQKICLDTTNMLKTSVKTSLVSSEDRCIPIEYTVQQHEIKPTCRSLIILSLTDSSEIGSSLCSEAANIETDTIYTNFAVPFLRHKNLVWECSYHNELKNGTETAYYRLAELNGIKLKSDSIIRYCGDWNNGQKEGKWLYYEKNGALNRTEIYKKGKLKKTVLNN